MGGFNPAWFIAIGVGVIVTLITTRDLQPFWKWALRMLATGCLAGGFLGLAYDFGFKRAFEGPRFRIIAASHMIIPAAKYGLVTIPPKDGTFVLIQVQVTSFAMPSTVLSYIFSVNVGSEKYEGKLQALRDFSIPSENGGIADIKGADSLPDKTLEPIATGKVVPGLLLYFFEGLPEYVLKNENATGVLTCFDVMGNPYSTTLKMWGPGSADFQRFPGLQTEIRPR